MPITIQPSVKSIDVNAHIISHLDDLNTAHLAKKALCFAKGLPFYTCIDEVKNIWTKELSNGEVYLVTRQLDFDKDVIVDTVISETR